MRRSASHKGDALLLVSPVSKILYSIFKAICLPSKQIARRALTSLSEPITE